MMEYLNIYLLTFNCARNPIDVDRFALHLFDALPGPAADASSVSFGAPELIVLSLQELAPIAYAFLGGSYLAPYFNSFNQALDLAVSKRWDAHYVNVVTENSGMTGLMVFARSDVTGKISRVETAHVGLGFQQMGNKGAVGARLGYRAAGEQPSGTVDLTFVAAHLAPAERAFQRRNEDWRNIVERLVFPGHGSVARKRIGTGDEPEESSALLQDTTSSSRGNDYSGIFVPTTYLFLAGDLNYRTSNTPPLQGDHVRFPQAAAPPGSPTHYSQLWKEDQLTREMREGNCFHGMSEAPITFLPTYKYSAAAREVARDAPQDTRFHEWMWTTHRWPSWCDRILYLDTPPWIRERGRVQPHLYDALPLFPTSDHRAVALSVSVPVLPIRVPDSDDHAADVRLAAPFPVDPEWQGKLNAARTKEIVVGCLAYLGLTWEGNGLLLATAIGTLGAWLVLRSLLEA